MWCDNCLKLVMWLGLSVFVATSKIIHCFTDFVLSIPTLWSSEWSILNIGSQEFLNFWKILDKISESFMEWINFSQSIRKIAIIFIFDRIISTFCVVRNWQHYGFINRGFNYSQLWCTSTYYSHLFISGQIVLKRYLQYFSEEWWKFGNYFATEKLRFHLSVCDARLSLESNETFSPSTFSIRNCCSSERESGGTTVYVKTQI